MCGGTLGGTPADVTGRQAKKDAEAAANRQAAEAARQRAEAEAAEQARINRIQQGTAAINDTFGKFNDEFYGGRKQAYIDFATPQLRDEYETAAKELAIALSRSGIASSSEAAKRRADLQKRYEQGLSTISNTAQDYANKARTSVEGARGDLLSLASQAADPTLVSQNAVSRAMTLEAMPNFNSLGTLLGDVTAGLATQAQLERRGQSRYNTGLFNVNPKTSQTIVEA